MFCGYDTNDSAMMHVTAGTSSSGLNMRDTTDTKAALRTVRARISRDVIARREITSAVREQERAARSACRTAPSP